MREERKERGGKAEAGKETPNPQGFRPRSGREIPTSQGNNARGKLGEPGGAEGIPLFPLGKSPPNPLPPEPGGAGPFPACPGEVGTRFPTPLEFPEHHGWLLSEEVEALPFLLLPLAGPEELPEEEMEREWDFPGWIGIFGGVPEHSRFFLRVFWRSRASPGSPVPAPGAPAGGGAGDPEDAAGNADAGGEFLGGKSRGKRGLGIWEWLGWGLEGWGGDPRRNFGVPWGFWGFDEDLVGVRKEFRGPGRI